MNTARRDRWRELLAPWRNASAQEYDKIGRLHHALMDEGDGCVDAHGVLWFRWTLGHNHNSITAQLEQLSLMAMLCGRDRNEFEALLSDLGDDYTRYVVEHRARYEPTYRMGVYIKIDDDEMLATVENGLLSEDVDVSAQYEKVRAELLEGRDAPCRVPLYIEFEAHGVTPKNAVASSLAMVKHLNVQREDQEGARIDAAFHVEAVQLFDVYDGEQLDVSSMAQLAQLADAGIRLPLFQFGSPFSTARTPDVLTQTVETIHALLGPQCVTNAVDGTPPRLRLEHLQVTTPMPTSLAVSVCTAVAQSKTLQCLEIDHDMARRMGREQFPMDRCWRWLAYALFSRDATHTIQMLQVTAEILSEFNADILRQVLALEDPLVALLDPRSQVESPAQNVVVDIPKGSEIALVYDYTRVKKDIATFTTPHVLNALRVLQDNKTTGWVTFLLPGWGECRVQRDLVTVKQGAEGQPGIGLLSRGIPHLRLAYISHEDIDPICNFLDVIGQQVRRLDLHEFEYEVPDVATHIVSFIRRCPNLEMLDLFAVKVETIQPLVAAFSRGECAIQRLKFRQLCVQDMSTVHAFFDTLADPTYAMTACLREISFHIFEQTIQDALRGSILRSCADMLAKNSTLQSCRAITLSKRRCGQFASQFNEFDGQPLPARKGPLTLRSKLAFLSVVLSPSSLVVTDQRDSPAIHRIDTNVVQTIFKLAAEHEIRQSVVEVPVRKW